MGRLLDLLLACAVTAAGCALLPDPTILPVAKIGTGLTPRMTPEQVAGEVLALISQMEEEAGSVARPARIVSITATRAENVGRLEPALGLEQPPPQGIRWLVRAEGTFVARSYPAGVAPPPAGEFGFVVVDDSTGNVVAYGASPGP